MEYPGKYLGNIGNKENLWLENPDPHDNNQYSDVHFVISHQREILILFYILRKNMELSYRKLTNELKRILTRKEALQIIRLMSWAVEESNSELIKNDFKRLSDRLMELTRDAQKPK